MAGSRRRPTARPIRFVLDRVQIVSMFRRDLTQPLPAAVARVPIEMYVATRDEILEEVALIAEPPRPWHRARFADRLDRGDVCFVGRVDGRLVAMNWTQHAPGEEEGMHVGLREGEIHTLHAYTIEAYRGRNIHAALLREMLLRAVELGYRSAYAKIRLGHRDSEKAHRRLGWERTGRGIVPTVRTRGRPVIRLTGSTHPWYRYRADDDR